MNCVELEKLLSEYAEGSLDEARKAEVERHLAACPACAAEARDAAAAVAFLRRAEHPEPPPELVTRIVFQLTSGMAQRQQRKRSWLSSLGVFLEPVLQPRFSMGMAMTILSFSLLARLAGIQVRQLNPSDLDPVKIWRTVDDRVHRAWTRAVKFYDTLQAVYEIRARLRELTEEPGPAAGPGEGAQNGAQPDKKK